MRTISYKRRQVVNSNLIYNIKYGFAALVAICIVVIISLYVISISDKNIRINPSAEYNDKVISGFVSILVDCTDKYNQTQLVAIKRQVDNIILDDTERADKVSVYTISSDIRDKKTVKVFFNPGSGNNISKWTRNPEKMKRNWRNSYKKPLKKVISEILSVEQEKGSSPIMEMIQTAAIDSFPVNGKKRKKKIIIISDMLHNTQEYSHYKHGYNYDDFSKLSYSRYVGTDLSDVEVNILYLNRKGAEQIQNRMHILFWEKFIHHLGGKLSKVIRISG